MGGGGGRGGRVLPLMFFTRKFLLNYWEKRGKENEENGEEKRKIVISREGEMKDGSGRSMKISRGLFFSLA